MDVELQKLKDIHLPPAISDWPAAPGWILLYFSLFILLFYAGYRWYRSKRKKQVVKLALMRLGQLQQYHSAHPETNVAAEISILLRRTALHYFSREKIAGLSGKQWLYFLCQQDMTRYTTKEIELLLTDAPYQKTPVLKIGPLFSAARSWLKEMAKEKS